MQKCRTHRKNLDDTFKCQPKIKCGKNMIACYEQLFAHIFDNLDELDEVEQFLER
jgi:hypothetical protein